MKVKSWIGSKQHIIKRVLKMKTILITDNTMNDKSKLNSISLLTNQILDKTLNQLEEEDLFVFPNIKDNSDDLSGDQMVLQSVNNSYRSSNVMGFLGFDDEELIIQSRFSLVQDDEQQNDDYFFQYLLEKVLDQPNVTDFETSFSQSERIFNLYIFLFPLYLKKAMRKGLYKTYVLRSYNNSNVKGIIDVKKHVQVNTPFVGNVAFKQREFSFDNALNQLVRHTIEYIKTKEFGKIILANVEINQIKSLNLHQIINILTEIGLLQITNIILLDMLIIMSIVYYSVYA
ncbi:hypothetical protein D0502_05540 [Leuconostoc falkenbergense]|uniref:Uncharacterized protein n=2 Tax=Leuconostoc falkenbergense TaxID=2766470 RepID=A0A9X3E7J7_9LACO|nr:hypothetical protein [Leuconostoc falkenbergense]